MTRTPESPRGARAWLLPVVKLCVSIGLIALLLSRIDMGQFWAMARTAAPSWLLAALALYLLMILASAWRWNLLLKAQGLVFRFRALTSSFLVATFFNNFLPSNIGGDVVRIRDTAPAAGSKTLATTVVLIDRGIGLLGLVLLAAVGATAVPRLVDGGAAGPSLLWGGFLAATVLAAGTLLKPQLVPRLLQPVRVLHPAWVDARLGRLGEALAGFRQAPGALLGCFAGAVAVQAILVGFYLAIARSLNVPVSFAELAVIVPISFLVQMIPVSINGFGVREATFGFYFSRLGLPLESALLVSFVGAALIMLFSVSGGVAYLLRKGSPHPAAA
jgi:glycosyltransferase 2 family protein